MKVFLWLDFSISNG